MHDHRFDATATLLPRQLHVSTVQGRVAPGGVRYGEG